MPSTTANSPTIRLFVAVVCAALLSGCATMSETGSVEAQAALDRARDPIESTNRAIFGFNRAADRILIKPVAQMYQQLLPEPARDGIRNFLDNLRTPVTLANDIFQGKLDRAAVTVQRFAINSTVGVGGLFDIARDFGVEGHREDFGQTLATWGGGEGMYLVLPILGPSNPRDAIGLVVDGFLDPVNYFVAGEAILARSLVRGTVERERVLDSLDEIERTSLDFYATLRSLYRQRRADEIRDGRPAPVIPIPGVSIDESEDTDRERLSQAN